MSVRQVARTPNPYGPPGAGGAAPTTFGAPPTSYGMPPPPTPYGGFQTPGYPPRPPATAGFVQPSAPANMNPQRAAMIQEASGGWSQTGWS